MAIFTKLTADELAMKIEQLEVAVRVAATAQDRAQFSYSLYRARDEYAQLTQSKRQRTIIEDRDNPFFGQ